MGEVDDEIHPMLADQEIDSSSDGGIFLTAAGQLKIVEVVHLRIIWCASTAHLTELKLGINKMNRGALCSGEAKDDSEGPGVREQHTSASPPSLLL